MHYIFTYYIGGVCNFSCSYCHQNDTLVYGSKNEQVKRLRTMNAMDSGSYEGSILLIQKFLNQGSLTINLFGGETFLYKKQLLYILKKLNGLNDSQKINVNISTNGSIYDEDVIIFFNNCKFKTKKIDVSWHILEHPEFFNKVEYFCNEIKRNFPKIDMCGTFVVHTNILKKQKDIIHSLLTLSKLLGNGGITINFDIARIWSKRELIETYALLKRLKQLRIDSTCNIFFETLICPELNNEIINLFLLPNGDVFMCPYMIITATDFERYNKHKLGNFLEISGEAIHTKVQESKKDFMFCETCVSGKKQCYFLDDSTIALNYIITTFFP